MFLTAILLRIFFDLNFISFSWLLCRFSFNLEFFLIIKCKDARIACDVLKIMCFKDFFFQKSFRVSKVSVGRVFYDFLLEWSVQWVFSEQKYHFRLKTEYSYFMTVLVLFQFVELILWIKKVIIICVVKNTIRTTNVCSKGCVSSFFNKFLCVFHSKYTGFSSWMKVFRLKRKDKTINQFIHFYWNSSF